MSVKSAIREYLSATLCVAMLSFSALTGAARAQDAPPAPVVASDEVKADWTTFAKAIGAVYGSVTFVYDADTDVSLVAKGVTVKGKQKTHFLAQRPDKVRSEVQMSLGEDLKDARRYQSISDGTTLWVNRLDKPRYSETPLDKTDLTKDLTAMGVLGSLYLNRELMGGLSSLTNESAEAVLPEFKKFNVEMSKAVETVDGKSVPVYTMTFETMKMNIRFFVDAVSATLSRIELQARDPDKGFVLKMVERLGPTKKFPALSDSLFTFAPPTGLEKAPTRIPVDFFQE